MWDGLVAGFRKSVFESFVEYWMRDCSSSPSSPARRPLPHPTTQFRVVSVHFLTDWFIRGTWGVLQQRSSSSVFCRKPLWKVLAWAGMSTLWCCPTSISPTDHGFAYPPRCPEGWFWRGRRGVWHAQTMKVSFSWQSPDEVPVDPQRTWSCSAFSSWSCAPGWRCVGEETSSYYCMHHEQTVIWLLPNLLYTSKWPA